VSVILNSSFKKKPPHFPDVVPANERIVGMGGTGIGMEQVIQEQAHQVGCFVGQSAMNIQQ